MKRKNLLILSAIVGLLILGGGAGYFFYLRPRFQHDGKDAKKGVVHLFASISPMVVNVHTPSGRFGLGGGSDGYLQVGFKLETNSGKVVDAFQRLRPAIRGNVLTLMLEVSPDVLTKTAARTALKNRVLASVNRTLRKDAPELGTHRFQRIYFTRFVTQSG